MTRKPVGEVEERGWKKGKDNGTERLGTLCHSQSQSSGVKAASKKIGSDLGEIVLLKCSKATIDR